jgi:hypothetical protein
VDIKKLYADKLKASNLSIKDGDKLHFSLLSGEQCKELTLPPYDAFKIPYFDLQGNTTDFYRVRYLQDTRTGFAKKTTGKGMRYCQVEGTLNEVYMPPLIKWADLAKDPSAALIITEGELKAACACKAGFATAGLGGVWMFRSGKNNLDALPWFSLVKWEGRTVYIIYDSDAAGNPNIINAEVVLCKLLQKLGAIPHIVRIPKEGKHKTGLDDYIVADGDVDALIAGAVPYKGVEMLHQLNTEVVYIRNPGTIMKLKNNQRLNVHDFVNHAYANRRYIEEVYTEKSSKKIEKSAPAEWVRWTGRSEVEQVVYEPGKVKLIGGDYNVWPEWGCEAKEGEVSFWQKQLDFIFKGDVEARKWFEQWCAYPIQNPGVKMYSAVVMWGLIKGTGKSFIGEILRKIYGKNASLIENKELAASFNEWAENKQFIVGNEITSGDSRHFKEDLKNMITRETVRLNPKHVRSYEIRDCINYYFTSNHPDSFFLEDGDRRFFIWEVRGTPMSEEYYTAMNAWYNSIGPSAVYDHLLRIDLTGFNPRGHAMYTRFKGEMINIGKSDLAMWVSNIVNNMDKTLVSGKTEYPYKLWRLEDLLKIFDPLGNTRVTTNGLAREMKKAGFDMVAEGMGCRTSLGQVRLWALRDIEYFDLLKGAEVGRYYDKERGRPDVSIAASKTKVKKKESNKL